ncbi:hypothetical protein O0L34_g9003 [Tuta absoluta]|nr:hypothetical protein O0L34_g9003 [Tuta absoluta]
MVTHKSTSKQKKTSAWQKSAGDMAHPRGRGLRDNEIEYALSDSEIELEDGEIDELCQDGDLDTAYVPPPEESSSSDDDEPLSDLRTTRGRARGRPRLVVLHLAEEDQDLVVQLRNENDELIQLIVEKSKFCYRYGKNCF